MDLYLLGLLHVYWARDKYLYYNYCCQYYSHLAHFEGNMIYRFLIQQKHIKFDNLNGKFLNTTKLGTLIQSNYGNILPSWYLDILREFQFYRTYRFWVWLTADFYRRSIGLEISHIFSISNQWDRILNGVAFSLAVLTLPSLFLFFLLYASFHMNQACKAKTTHWSE